MHTCIHKLSAVSACILCKRTGNNLDYDNVFPCFHNINVITQFAEKIFMLRKLNILLTKEDLKCGRRRVNNSVSV